MPWSMEELYIAENDREAFIKVLEEKLHPVYDSARIQGYEIWRMWNVMVDKNGDNNILPKEYCKNMT